MGQKQTILACAPDFQDLGDIIVHLTQCILKEKIQMLYF